MLPRRIEKPAKDAYQHWFGPADASIFPYWHSKLLDNCSDRIMEDWVRKGLPKGQLDWGDSFRGRRIGMPPSIVAHAQELEARDK